MTTQGFENNAPAGSPLGDVIRKIRADLQRRGPSGKPLGHVVLTREQAEVLLAGYEQAISPVRPRSV